MVKGSAFGLLYVALAIARAKVQEQAGKLRDEAESRWRRAVAACP